MSRFSNFGTAGWGVAAALVMMLAISADGPAGSNRAYGAFPTMASPSSRSPQGVWLAGARPAVDGRQRVPQFLDNDIRDATVIHNRARLLDAHVGLSPVLSRMRSLFGERVGDETEADRIYEAFEAWFWIEVGDLPRPAASWAFFARDSSVLEALTNLDRALRELDGAREKVYQWEIQRAVGFYATALFTLGTTPRPLLRGVLGRLAGAGIFGARSERGNSRESQGIGSSRVLARTLFDRVMDLIEGSNDQGLENVFRAWTCHTILKGQWVRRALVSQP